MVPRLVGLAAITAHDVALDAHLLAVDQDPCHTPAVAGVVAAQLPTPGTYLTPGSQVRIWVKTGSDGDGGGGGGGQRVPTGPTSVTPSGAK
ncbi:PASTA domain-containing protein [Pseudonocardia acaciae]|uniref:PASTA domain-containing protein n=1 Tax=Pseudonocardia acaciae TaxID=551276 RepID=UPI0012ECE337|nr:PASTA domain-containing protein [Pseudonocardia acaciae]